MVLCLVLLVCAAPAWTDTAVTLGGRTPLLAGKAVLGAVAGTAETTLHFTLSEHAEDSETETPRSGAPKGPVRLCWSWDNRRPLAACQAWPPGDPLEEGRCGPSLWILLEFLLCFSCTQPNLLNQAVFPTLLRAHGIHLYFCFVQEQGPCSMPPGAIHIRMHSFSDGTAPPPRGPSTPVTVEQEESI